MFKVQHIALTAAFYGLHAQTASAQTAGCFPGWVSDRPYSADSRVSARITSTTAIVTTTCTVDSSGCDTDGFMRTGGVTTATMHNLRCTGAPAFCSQRNPAGQFGSTVWTQESATCSGTVLATETIPDAWAGGGCPTAFVSGTDYDPESIVTVDMGTFSLVYQCTSASNNLFCGQSGYEPGTSQYWSLAWTELGSCTGMLSPTASPIFDEIDFLSNPSGCPRDFSNPSVSYEAGDLVSVTVSTSPERKVVYECRQWPNSGYCSQVGGSLDPGQEYGFLGWTLKGACTGMLAPTGAPTPYDNTDCTYIRCTTATSCTPGATANGIAGSTACSCGSGATRNSSCRQVTCTETDVDVYSRSTTYAAGDISRRGRQKFTCMIPGWCNQAAYQPRMEPGIWSLAWTMSGSCPALNPALISSPFFLSTELSGLDCSSVITSTLLTNYETQIRTIISASLDETQTLTELAISTVCDNDVSQVMRRLQSQGGLVSAIGELQYVSQEGVDFEDVLASLVDRITSAGNVISLSTQISLPAPADSNSTTPVVLEVGSVEVSVEVGLTLEGIDFSDIVDTGLDEVVDLLKSVLGELIPEGADVRILSIGGVSFTRRLLRILQESSTGVDVEFEIVTTTMCSTSVCNAAETETITNAQTQEVALASTVLQAQVANGDFANAIQAEAASIGVSTFTNVSVDASSLTISEPQVTIEEATPVPSSVPSISSQPSSQPSNQPSSNPSISSQPSE